MPTLQELFESSLDSLTSPEDGVRLEAVRTLKHTMVGSQAKKTEFVLMGGVPKLVTLLRLEEASTDLLVEVFTVLGSLAYGTPETVQAVLSAEALPLLFEGLLRPEEALVTASVRALCTLYLSGRAPSELVYQNQKVVLSLVQFLQSRHVVLSKSAATIIAQSCTTFEQRCALASAGVLPALSTLICRAQKCDVFLHAIEALSAVVLQNRETSRQAVDDLDFVRVLSGVLSTGQSAPIKLGAAQCLTNLCRADALYDSHEVMRLKVLPTLVKYCRKTEEARIRIKALQVLSYLVEDSVPLQLLAVDSERMVSNLVTNLDAGLDRKEGGSEALQGKDEEVIVGIKEGSLEVLASLSTHKEDIRLKILQHKKVLMKHIVSGLQGEELGLKTASLKCLLVWSRSPQHLRTTMLDNDLWKHLLEMLGHKDEFVLLLATSALCNFLLPVSACRKPLVEGGVVNTLFNLLNHHSLDIKTNIVWALMNLSHQGLDPDDLKKFEDNSALATMISICSESPCPKLQFKALCVIGNLFTTDAVTIELLFNQCKDSVRGLVHQLLTAQEEDDLLEHTLILILNIASGTHKCKMAILDWDIFMRMAAIRIKDSTTPDQVFTPLIAILTALADRNVPNALVRHSKLEDYMIKYSLQKCQTTVSDTLLPLVLSLISVLSDSMST